MKRILCTVLALAMLASIAAMAADEKKPAAPAAAQPQDPGMAAMMPGEHHAHMQKLAGEFDYTITMMMPGMPAQEYKGHRSAKMIMGGRYLEETYTGTVMGMPFEGRAFMAYDNTQKKYLSTWMDNEGTGIMMGSGQCANNGTEWNMTANTTDPMSGKMITTRNVTRLVDADHMTVDMFAPGPDGKEIKMASIVAARTK